jgi:hypothetical protein
MGESRQRMEGVCADCCRRWRRRRRLERNHQVYKGALSVTQCSLEGGNG